MVKVEEDQWRTVYSNRTIKIKVNIYYKEIIEIID